MKRCGNRSAAVALDELPQLAERLLPATVSSTDSRTPWLWVSQQWSMTSITCSRQSINWASARRETRRERPCRPAASPRRRGGLRFFAPGGGRDGQALGDGRQPISKITVELGDRAGALTGCPASMRWAVSSSRQVSVSSPRLGQETQQPAQARIAGRARRRCVAEVAAAAQGHVQQRLPLRSGQQVRPAAAHAGRVAPQSFARSARRQPLPRRPVRHGAGTGHRGADHAGGIGRFHAGLDDLFQQRFLDASPAVDTRPAIPACRAAAGCGGGGRRPSARAAAGGSAPPDRASRPALRRGRASVRPSEAMAASFHNWATVVRKFKRLTIRSASPTSSKSVALGRSRTFRLRCRRRCCRGSSRPS